MERKQEFVGKVVSASNDKTVIVFKVQPSCHHVGFAPGILFVGKIFRRDRKGALAEDLHGKR